MIHPSKTTFTDEEHDAIRAELRIVMKGPPALTQADLARQTDLGDSTISEYLNRKYRGDMNVVGLALRKWLDATQRAVEIRARQPKAPVYQSLSDSQKLLALIDLARVTGDIVSYVGNPGTGKTTTALRYTAANPARAWYVPIDEATAGVQPMLQEILAAQGKKNLVGSPAQLRKIVVDEALEGPCVFIIDESNLLSEKSLNQVRAIWDATDRAGKPAGFVLIGNPVLGEKLGPTGTKVQMAQISSRVGHRRVIDAPDPQDVNDLAWAWANENGEHLTPAELKICQDMAARPGGLRNLSKAFRNALLVSMANNEPLQAQHLRGAFHQLSGIWL